MSYQGSICVTTTRADKRDIASTPAVSPLCLFTIRKLSLPTKVTTLDLYNNHNFTLFKKGLFI